MLKKMLILVLSAIIFSGCGLSTQKSGVELIAYPKAKVYINNKEMGMTPYKNSDMVAGEIRVKLVADSQEYDKKIELKANSHSVINWEFGKNEQESGGYLIYMEKTGDKNKAGLMVNANPDRAAVIIDGENKGFTPMRLDDVGDGDKELTISFPRHKSINVFIKAVKGYQIVVEAKLVEEPEVLKEIEPQITSTPSAQINTSQKVVIKETETGWLRVRGSASNNGTEISKVKPNDKYPLLEETNGWYKIDLGENKNGWISSKYAEKTE